jgi:xanthine/uracil permease
MAADGEDRRSPGRRRYQPLGLLTAVLLVVLIFAIFFLPFLVLPLAILVVFYIGFAASDRARRMHHEPIASSAKQTAPEPSALHHPASARDDEPGAA